MEQEEPPLLPLRWRLLHWGPIGAMSIVACVCITSIYCHLQWWPPERSFAGLLDMLVFLIWNYLVLSNMFQASYVGPGYVPLRWRPANSDDEKYLQNCEHCNGFKTPRAHHCRVCKRCVMKMDHHCPWINNCCGHRNQGYFVAFLLSAVTGCLHASFILGPSIYWAIFRVWYLYYGTGREPKVELGLYGLFAAVFAFGLAVAVVISVGFLFLIQLRSIIRNKTGIEEYIVAKANRRERDDEFIYPYNLGWKKNLQQVFTLDLTPRSDGIVWPVREGCHQYTLTLEQIEQKRLKRLMAVEYQVTSLYDGGYCLSRQHGGCCASCSQPCFTGEARLKLRENDRVLVTHWRRHWLYGDKQILNYAENGGNIRAQRGWFPRRCVVEVIDDEESDRAEDEDSGKYGSDRSGIGQDGVASRLGADSNGDHSSHHKTE